jgi:hypothetical protein
VWCSYFDVFRGAEACICIMHQDVLELCVGIVVQHVYFTVVMFAAKGKPVSVCMDRSKISGLVLLCSVFI